MAQIRKQVYDLTVEDLATSGVGEFALDEEGEDGQDEATVRPYLFEEPLDCDAGMFIVRARFVMADGTVTTGYLTPPVQGDASLGTLQPVIITPAGQIPFWCGIIPLDAAAVASQYRRLGKAGGSEVFPLRFESDVPLSCGNLRGELAGFLIVEDMKTMQTRTVA